MATGKRLEAILWAIAAVAMLTSAVYQRRTGPSHPVRGRIEVADQSYSYSLKRNDYSTRDARVAIPRPGPGVGGALHWKRYPTSDEFRTVPLRPEDGELVGELPAQPAAGKLEYYITLDTPDGELRVPRSSEEKVIIRFKDPVPIYVLLPHVVFMFFSVLIGMRTGLAALFAPRGMRRLAWITLGGMTAGGMVLGPIVQKLAFGAFWTGFPFGYDLTDNKVLVMWLVWIVACLVIGFRPRRNERAARLVVVAAALVMMVVYLIPHSAQGSELDYEALERGVPASEAVRTGGRGN
ncbi:MAG: hypothetical protein PVG79_03520 [Gemmatimonadales bacterium]|jgi:hypothetical protein